MQQTSAHNINKQTFFREKKNCLAEKFFRTTSTISTPPMASTNTHLNSYGLQWTPMDSNGLQWSERLSSRYAVSNLHLQWPPMGSYGQHLSAQDMLYQISTSNGLLWLQWSEPLSLHHAVSNLHLPWPPIGSNGHGTRLSILYQIYVADKGLDQKARLNLAACAHGGCWLG